MTDALGAEGAGTPAREVGWWRPLLATFALLFLPVTPLFRLAVPVEQTLLLLAPLLAVCALVGWRSGGRLSLAILWTALAAWVLWQGSSGAGSFSLLARGWSFVLASAFGSMLLSPVGESFLPKALLALLAAMAVGFVLLLLTPEGVSGAAEVLAGELARRGDQSTSQWRELTGSPEWSDFVRATPDAARLGEEVDRQLVAMPALGRRVAPALLALESLGAMALAWSLYHRVGRARVGPALAKLRDLRFDDSLVWGVIVGLVVVVLPLGGVVRDLGIDLLVFFGALYALRGLGVLVWFLSPGRWTAALLVVFTVFFWYVVAAVAITVGLGDTWSDWRRRSRQRSQRSE